MGPGDGSFWAVEAFAGRYQLIDLVGTGGMGSVWRAWDLRRTAYVAAKVLGQHDAATLLRFVREQSLRIDHPHVVAPHGWAADDDKVVFAMDLVRGGSVATLLGDHGPLPESYVAVLLDQVLHGLSAVHAAGIVHRDLKPANLLLDATGTGRPHLRLSDFGVAGLLDEPRMTRHSTVLGTPGYIAPEQLAGADPDPRQDLYTVGAVAAELLTGVRPDLNGTLSNGEGALWELIRTLTAASPTARPASAAEAGRLLAQTSLLPPAGLTPGLTIPIPPRSSTNSRPSHPPGRPPVRLPRPPPSRNHAHRSRHHLHRGRCPHSHWPPHPPPWRPQPTTAPAGASPSSGPQSAASPAPSPCSPPPPGSSCAEPTTAEPGPHNAIRALTVSCTADRVDSAWGWALVRVLWRPLVRMVGLVGVLLPAGLLLRRVRTRLRV